MTDTAEATEEAPPREEAPAKRPWWLRHYTFTGTAVGLVFLWLSMTPSLLPRGPLFQGLVSGAAGAIGYGLGVFARLAGALHAVQGLQSAGAALGVAGACRRRHHRHDRR